jgi:hypothetical protein
MQEGLVREPNGQVTVGNERVGHHVITCHVLIKVIRDNFGIFNSEADM